METTASYIVILWCVPAFLFIVLPLISLLVWMALQGSLHIGALFSRLANAKRQASEQRATERKKVSNVRADISDGLGSCSGLVANVSRMGLCIKNVPESLQISNALLSVVVRDAKTTYRVVARPRWEKWHSNGVKTIGAEIASYPNHWNEFVMGTR